MSNYFAIHTVNRDGQFIYYDKVFIKSNLSMKELETDDFKMKFLDLISFKVPFAKLVIILSYFYDPIKQSMFNKTLYQLYNHSYFW